MVALFSHFFFGRHWKIGIEIRRKKKVAGYSKETDMADRMTEWENCFPSLASPQASDNSKVFFFFFLEMGLYTHTTLNKKEKKNIPPACSGKQLTERSVFLFFHPFMLSYNRSTKHLNSFICRVKRWIPSAYTRSNPVNCKGEKKKKRVSHCQQRVFFLNSLLNKLMDCF